MSEPHPKLLKNFEDSPSPKQKLLFRKLSGRDLHPDIHRKGGASMAIQAIMTQSADKVINKVQLPWGCFCDKFGVNDQPLRSSLVDPKYKDGITMGLLYRSIAAHLKVKRAAVEQRAKMEESGMKRSYTPLVSPKLGSISVKRSISGG